MRKGDDLTTFIVQKVMKNPEALTFRIPKGLLRPVLGKLYFYMLEFGGETCGIIRLAKLRLGWDGNIKDGSG